MTKPGVKIRSGGWNGLDTRTIEKLIEEHGAALRLFAAQWCRAPDDAVQDMLVELAQRTDLPDSLANWAFRVVRNKAISRSRSERRRRRREQVAQESKSDWFQSDPSTNLEAQRCLEAMTQLGETERGILVARLWSQLTFQQISEIFEMSTSRVYRMYQAAIESMRKELGIEDREKISS